MNETDRMKNQAEPGYGKRLQEARLNAGLSTESVAESLRLDPRFVLALEQEDADTLPAPTYTRGYIRAYAQLVRCNADELIAQYNVHAGGEPELTDITASAVEKPADGGGPATFWISLVVVGALIVLLAVWAYDSLRPLYLQPGKQSGGQIAKTDPFPSPAASGETAISASGLPDMSNTASVAATSSDATGQAVEESVVQEVQQSDVPDGILSGTGEGSGVEQNFDVDGQLSPPADSVVEIREEVTFADETAATAPESDNAVVPAAPRGSDILRLNFRGRSWAEVVDANGFQLAYGMFESRTLNFEGQAPFRVMLGDATQVDVTVNGTKVGLKPYIRWNKTANLSVGKARGSSD